MGVGKAQPPQGGDEGIAVLQKVLAQVATWQEVSQSCSHTSMPARCWLAGSIEEGVIKAINTWQWEPHWQLPESPHHSHLMVNGAARHSWN